MLRAVKVRFEWRVTDVTCTQEMGNCIPFDAWCHQSFPIYNVAVFVPKLKRSNVEIVHPKGTLCALTWNFKGKIQLITHPIGLVVHIVIIALYIYQWHQIHSAFGCTTRGHDNSSLTSWDEIKFIQTLNFILSIWWSKHHSQVTAHANSRGPLKQMTRSKHLKTTPLNLVKALLNMCSFNACGRSKLAYVSELVAQLRCVSNRGCDVFIERWWKTRLMSLFTVRSRL